SRAIRSWLTIRSSTRSRTSRRAPGWSRGSISPRPCRIGRWLTSSTSCCVAATRRRPSPDMSGITPSQTVGPYFAIALTPGGYDWVPSAGNDLLTPDASGERIRIEGRVLDGDAKPVDDAMIEIWQADSAGRYAHPADERAN